MINDSFTDVVLNRASVKVFDETVKIPREEMLEIINQTAKAPSSVNLQPWRFVIVESEEGKNILRPLVRKNIRQNDTSAAMIVIFGDLRSYENAETIYSRAVEKGYMTPEFKAEKMAFFMPKYENATPREIADKALLDSSLAAMQLMLVARAHGYDTNAIGGFEKDQIAQALGLDPERYLPVLIVAIGKANYQPHDTVRLAAEEITTFK
ncbi:nitroreductase family protein [Boudabousia marimammalium]|uniref:Nitroreductase family protein n=1 Tax=Boudabousia marimammalium TaxID=156892 RepID=A0A1Q5PRU6_9ACTO|nr:nitroreductase family protein [Boudabousia marimammalium]OKL50301.1 nitroreductase family protein [Boudabousia marimammalium]